jgi:hypothetical protein
MRKPGCSRQKEKMFAAPGGEFRICRLEFEIREIVAFVVVKGKQLHTGLGERDDSNLGLVPNVHAAGGQGQLSLMKTDQNFLVFLPQNRYPPSGPAERSSLGKRLRAIN